MRRLTFKGFLGSYVQTLTGSDSLALRTLAARLDAEPRLVEPLLLWVAVTQREDDFSRLLGDRKSLKRELGELVQLRNAGKLEATLDSGRALRSEYGKAWQSYVTRRDAPARDAELKLEARRQVLSLEKQAGVSRYRMAKDLGLNPGNLHAFLAQGNPSKLSLARAYELVEYLRAA